MKLTNRKFYWALVITFTFLYLLVAFVSTLHAIDFFRLANVGGLAILLGVAYEIGQASVLFAILLTKNKDKFLPWALMILLTALQMTANVYASFKHMVTSGSEDWVFWQKSILFGVQASSPEMYQIIISWISGALLPVVALGMTALVAQNIRLMTDEEEQPQEPQETLDEPKKETYQKAQAYIAQSESKDLDNLLDQLDNIKKNQSKKPKLFGIDSAWENIDADDKKETELWDAASLTDLATLYPEPEIEPPKEPERPPKQNDEAVELKKAEELLPKEDVKVPQRKKRVVDPLKKKSKVRRIKSLDEVMTPSKGDEVIALIEKQEKEKEKVAITEEISLEKEPLSEPVIIIEEPKPYVETGVEVLDAKAVPRKPRLKSEVDKFGIPIKPGERRNFDRL